MKPTLKYVVTNAVGEKCLQKEMPPSDEGLLIAGHLSGIAIDFEQGDVYFYDRDLQEWVKQWKG